jgi:four helix bundle protein
MKDFRKLDVWHKAHQLAVQIYKVTEKFPSSEIYGLTSQLRRAGVSIPTNLAEGCGRSSDPDLARFIGMAMGSASEVEYLLLLTRELGLLDRETSHALETQIVEIKKMLAALIKSVCLG